MITLILVAAYFWMAGVVSEWAHDITVVKKPSLDMQWLYAWDLHGPIGFSCINQEGGMSEPTT
ncbi:TPA: hypothetical protein ACWDIM_004433 [Yersinia enterocolitica]